MSIKKLVRTNVNHAAYKAGVFAYRNRFTKYLYYKAANGAAVLGKTLMGDDYRNNLTRRILDVRLIEFNDISAKYMMPPACSFIEGKLAMQQTDCYFHLFTFPKGIILDSKIHEIAERIASVNDRKITKGVYYPGNDPESETSKALRPFNKHGIFIFPHFFSQGASAEEVKVEYPDAVLISDVSNYPYNDGFFIIKDGRLLEEGPCPTTGKHWALIKKGEAIKPELLSFPLQDDQIKSVQFGISLNPIIIDGEAISLTGKIPQTQETLIHNFGQCFCHLFMESIPEVAEHVQRLVGKSEAMVDKELRLLLDEKGTVTVKIDPKRLEQSNMNIEKIMDKLRKNGYQLVKNPEHLQVGQCYIDEIKYVFKVRLKRALYGHTILGVTKNGRVLVFKIFNRQAKDNGLYLEQLGETLNHIADNIGEKVIFAGVGANGGDVRTFLGHLKDYKNISEDGKILQEKITNDICRDKKPTWLTISYR